MYKLKIKKIKILSLTKIEYQFSNLFANIFSTYQIFLPNKSPWII